MSVDPFTAANYQYRRAMQNCDKTGEAFEVTSAGVLRNVPAFIIIMAVLAAVSSLWWLS